MTLERVLDLLAHTYCRIRRGHAWILRHDGGPGDGLVMECLYCLAHRDGWNVITRAGPRPAGRSTTATPTHAAATPGQVDAIVDAIDRAPPRNGSGGLG